MKDLQVLRILNVNWVTIGVASADSTGVVQFSDAEAGKYTTRFYRVVSE